MNTNSVEFFKSSQSKVLTNKQEIILAVWEIGNPENAGQIIRLGHNIKAQKVIFINETVNFRESKIKKTAGFSFDQMNWEFITPETFFQTIDKELSFVVLETCDGSENIFLKSLPDKIVLLAGSESHGLPESVIKRSDLKVHIPMPGGCKSMNVSHALSVAAFEWYRQKTI